MPAYRSEAEAEIRNEVVSRLRTLLPSCRIIHEINASSFGNRIDVLAVTEDRIAAVEIKSVKDTLKRLTDQIGAMRGVAHHTISALHEKFLIKDGEASPDWRNTAHIEDRTIYNRPNESGGSVLWTYPMKERIGFISSLEWNLKDWHEKSSLNLPPYALHMLWAAELKSICERNDIKKSGTMEVLRDRINWELSGVRQSLKKYAHICARVCVEADEPIPL